MVTPFELTTAQNPRFSSDSWLSGRAQGPRLDDNGR
jgi:hypothetical protein